MRRSRRKAHFFSRFLAGFLIAGQLVWGPPVFAVDTLRSSQEAETRAAGVEEVLRPTLKATAHKALPWALGLLMAVGSSGDTLAPPSLSPLTTENRFEGLRTELRSKIVRGPGLYFWEPIPHDPEKLRQYLPDLLQYVKQHHIRKVYLPIHSGSGMWPGDPHEKLPSLEEADSWKTLTKALRAEGVQVWGVYGSWWWGDPDRVNERLGDQALPRIQWNKERDKEPTDAWALEYAVPVFVRYDLKQIDKLLENFPFDGMYFHLEPYWIARSWTPENTPRFLNSYLNLLEQVHARTSKARVPLMVNSYQGAMDVPGALSKRLWPGLGRSSPTPVAEYKGRPLLHQIQQHSEAVNIWFQLVERPDMTLPDLQELFRAGRLGRDPVEITVEWLLNEADKKEQTWANKYWAESARVHEQLLADQPAFYGMTLQGTIPNLTAPPDPFVDQLKFPKKLDKAGAEEKLWRGNHSIATPWRTVIAGLIIGAAVAVGMPLGGPALRGETSAGKKKEEGVEQETRYTLRLIDERLEEFKAKKLSREDVLGWTVFAAYGNFTMHRAMRTASKQGEKLFEADGWRVGLGGKKVEPALRKHVDTVIDRISQAAKTIGMPDEKKSPRQAWSWFLWTDAIPALRDLQTRAEEGTLSKENVLREWTAINARMLTTHAKLGSPSVRQVRARQKATPLGPDIPRVEEWSSDAAYRLNVDLYRGVGVYELLEQLAGQMGKETLSLKAASERFREISGPIRQFEQLRAQMKSESALEQMAFTDLSQPEKLLYGPASKLLDSKGKLASGTPRQARDALVAILFNIKAPVVSGEIEGIVSGKKRKTEGAFLADKLFADAYFPLLEDLRKAALSGDLKSRTYVREHLLQLEWQFPSLVRFMEEHNLVLQIDTIERLNRLLAETRKLLLNPPGKKAGAEELAGESEAGRELRAGMRPAVPEARWMVIGPSIAKHFAGLEEFAGIGRRVMVDPGNPEGRAQMLMQVAEAGGDAVHYYGGAEEADSLAALAGRFMEIVPHSYREPGFPNQMEQALIQAGLPTELIAAGIEALAAGMEELRQAA